MIGAFLLSMAAALAFAVAAEYTARGWIRWRRLYYVQPPGLRLRFEPDRAAMPHCEPRTRYDVNRAGERGDPLPFRRPGLYRVLVVGGSQPEGLFLDQDSYWPGALQARLRVPAHLAALGARRVYVGCVARSGVGAEALRLILEKILPRYPRLDAIVVLVGASDIMRWLEEGAPPTPATAPTVAELFRCHPDQRFRWMPRQTALCELARRLRRRWLKPVIVHREAGRWMRSARLMRRNAVFMITRAPDPAPMLRHFERCFQDLLRMAQAQARRVVVVQQPWFDGREGPAETAHIWSGGVGQPWKAPTTTFYSMDVMNRLMRVMNAGAARVAAELGIESVDLMPLLPPSPDCYYDYLHLTPKGASIVADAVAATLVASADSRELCAVSQAS